MSEITPLHEFVDALLEVVAPVMQMLDDLANEPDAPSIDETIETVRRLLREAFTALEANYNLPFAAEVLEAAAPMIIEMRREWCF